MTQFTNRQLNFLAPEGFLINGKIVPSVTTNNLTVAIKTLAGADPSASDPVRVRIGDTLHSITSALSVTANAGTNWFNAGSSELATKEIDYFVYLGYNATDGVVIGFSRIPSANSYDDFSATTTDEKYCAISTITNAVATDYYSVIGRFAATLSAGTAYTWTVPTFTAKNLIQRPIRETRWLAWVPQFVNATAPTYTLEFINVYKMIGDKLDYSCNWINSSGGTAGSGAVDIFASLPFSVSTSQINQTNRGSIGNGLSYEDGGTIGLVNVARRAANTIALMKSNATNILNNDQSSDSRFIMISGKYAI